MAGGDVIDITPGPALIAAIQDARETHMGSFLIAAIVIGAAGYFLYTRYRKDPPKL
jgi:hypothetical protein